MLRNNTSLNNFVIFVVELGILTLTASSCRLESKQPDKKCLCLKHKIQWHLFTMLILDLNINLTCLRTPIPSLHLRRCRCKRLVINEPVWHGPCASSLDSLGKMFCLGFNFLHFILGLLEFFKFFFKSKTTKKFYGTPFSVLLRMANETLHSLLCTLFSFDKLCFALY